MNGIEDTLSITRYLLSVSRVLAFDWPASKLLELVAPPPPDLTDLDMEAKLRILRGEEPDWTNWWSPVTWIDKSEEWMKQWMETSKYAQIKVFFPILYSKASFFLFQEHR